MIYIYIPVKEERLNNSSRRNTFSWWWI